MQGVDDRRVVAKIPEPKVEPEPKTTKKDALGREIVYEVVSKYGKGIGWWQVVRFPDGEYGIHRISREGSREVDAYGGMEKSLSDAKKLADRYGEGEEQLYEKRIQTHRDKLQNLLESNRTQLNNYYDRVILQNEGYVKTCREEMDSTESEPLKKYYRKKIAAGERKIASTKNKQKNLEKLWEQHEKKDKLYLYGNKKLVADARLVLKEDFGITDKDADKLFTPNLKLEYSTSTKFAGRCTSTGSTGSPAIQISSRAYRKDADISEVRDYRDTMIHELIHHMRLWELDRARFSPTVQHELLKTVYDRSDEERHTVMETQLRGAPDYLNTSKDSYYMYLKNLPENVGEEDNKILTCSKNVKKVISTKEIAENISTRGDMTHISKLELKGRSRWIDRTMVTSEGDVVRIYDPKARKPNRKADARTIDAEDKEIGEEDVFEIMQDGTKKLIIRARG